MITAWILLIIGLFLVLAEFYLPGGIVGVIGGIAIGASIVIFGMSTDSLLAIFTYLTVVVIAVGFLIKFALWRIPRAKPGMSIYLSSDQEGYQAAKFDASAIGKRGIVATDLKPGGHITVEGKRMQAISQSGYLVKGTEVIVIGGQEESLIVKRATKENPS